MSVEVMQCPKCGSPLEAGPLHKLVTCTYCDSTVRVTRGASGHPLGVLVDIKADTEIIAKQTAINHLRERLQSLAAERAQLDAALQGEIRAAVSGGLPGRANPSSLRAAGIMLAAGGGFVLFSMWISSGLLGGYELMCWTLFVVMTGIGVLLTARAQDLFGKLRLLAEEARRKAELQHGPQLARLDEDIQAGHARIAELQAEMDELAKVL